MRSILEEALRPVARWMEGVVSFALIMPDFFDLLLLNWDDCPSKACEGPPRDGIIRLGSGDFGFDPESPLLGNCELYKAGRAVWAFVGVLSIMYDVRVSLGG